MRNDSVDIITFGNNIGVLGGVSINIGGDTSWYFSSYSGVTATWSRSGTSAYYAMAPSLRFIPDPPEPRIVYREIIEYIYKEKTVTEYVSGSTVYVNIPTKGENQRSTLYLVILIAVVSIIVSKLILPKMNYRFLFKAIVGLVYRPGKKQLAQIKNEWKKAVGS